LDDLLLFPVRHVSLPEFGWRWLHRVGGTGIIAEITDVKQVDNLMRLASLLPQEEGFEVEMVSGTLGKRKLMFVLLTLPNSSAFFVQRSILPHRPNISGMVIRDTSADAFDRLVTQGVEPNPGPKTWVCTFCNSTNTEDDSRCYVCMVENDAKHDSRVDRQQHTFAAAPLDSPSVLARRPPMRHIASPSSSDDSDVSSLDSLELDERACDLSEDALSDSGDDIAPLQLMTDSVESTIKLAPVSKTVSSPAIKDESNKNPASPSRKESSRPPIKGKKKKNGPTGWRCPVCHIENLGTSRFCEFCQSPPVPVSNYAKSSVSPAVNSQKKTSPPPTKKKDKTQSPPADHSSKVGSPRKGNKCDKDRPDARGLRNRLQVSDSRDMPVMAGSPGDAKTTVPKIFGTVPADDGTIAVKNDDEGASVKLSAADMLRSLWEVDEHDTFLNAFVSAVSCYPDATTYCVVGFSPFEARSLESLGQGYITAVLGMRQLHLELKHNTFDVVIYCSRMYFGGRIFMKNYAGDFVVLGPDHRGAGGFLPTPWLATAEPGWIVSQIDTGVVVHRSNPQVTEWLVTQEHVLLHEELKGGWLASHATYCADELDRRSCRAIGGLTFKDSLTFRMPSNLRIIDDVYNELKSRACSARNSYTRKALIQRVNDLCQKNADWKRFQSVFNMSGKTLMSMLKKELPNKVIEDVGGCLSVFPDSYKREMRTGGVSVADEIIFDTITYIDATLKVAHFERLEDESVYSICSQGIEEMYAEGLPWYKTRRLDLLLFFIGMITVTRTSLWTSQLFVKILPFWAFYPMFWFIFSVLLAKCFPWIRRRRGEVFAWVVWYFLVHVGIWCTPDGFGDDDSESVAHASAMALYIPTAQLIAVAPFVTVFYPSGAASSTPSLYLLLVTCVTSIWLMWDSDPDCVEVHKKRYQHADYSGASQVTGHGPATADRYYAAPSVYQKKERDQAAKFKASLNGYPIQRVDEPWNYDVQRVFLPHSGMLCALKQGPTLLWHSIHARNLVKVPSGNAARYKAAAAAWTKNWATEVLIPWTDDQVIDHVTIGWKKRKLREASLIMNSLDGPVYERMFPFHATAKFPGFCGGFAKANEVLHYQSIDGEQGVKPRTVVSLDSKVLLALQRDILPAGDVFKQRIDEVFVCELFGVTRTWHVASAAGMISSDLTAWRIAALARLENGTWSMIVLGDDSVVVWARNGTPCFSEFDYSHFDNSQKDEQIEAEMDVWKALGVPVGARDLLKSVYRAPQQVRSRSDTKSYVMRHDPGRNEDGTPKMRRVTGAPTTSLGNSMVNVLAILQAGHASEPFSDGAWEATGLNCKVKVHHDAESLDLTFLRGVWLPFSDGIRHWTPMPSQVCKLCKVIRTDTTPTSLLQFAFGIAQGYSGVPRNMPVLGSFLACLTRCGSPGKVVDLEKHKIHTEGVNATLDRSLAMEWFCDRYSVTIAEVEDCERILDSISTLPYFVGHKVMTHLAADYGSNPLLE
jgi:hypothetical protein